MNAASHLSAQPSCLRSRRGIGHGHAALVSPRPRGLVSHRDRSSSMERARPIST